MTFDADDLELLRDLVDRWLVSLHESQRVALTIGDVPVPDEVFAGLEEQIARAERVRDTLREA